MESQDRKDDRRKRGVDTVKESIQEEDLFDFEEELREGDFTAKVDLETKNRKKDVAELWEEVIDLQREQTRTSQKLDNTVYDVENLASTVDRRLKAVETAMHDMLEREEKIRITLSPMKKCTGKEWHGTGPDDGKANAIIKLIDASEVGAAVKSYDPTGRVLH